MKRILASVITLASVTLLGTTDASAQQFSAEGKRSWFQDHVAAPSTPALELTIASGYTQGFGMLQGGVGMSQVATPGVGFDVGAAYRMNRSWAIGVTGQYQELYAPRADSARGMTAGIAASYHFAPEMRIDPWAEIGTGYRLLWQDGSPNSPTIQTHGFQLARARVGFDVRFSPDFAIGPVVGADVNVFLWQDTGPHVAIANPQPSTFVFAGLQGRMDIGGGDQSRSQASAKPQPVPAYWVPPPPTSETTVTSAVIAKDEETTPVSPSISVSEEIARACHLNFADVQKAPKFELDKAALLPTDHEVLTKIAACLAVGGALEGRSIQLIGRADPRGTQEYNMALGTKRARNVASFLERFGVETTRIHETSRGELDATGKDEATWQIDRRVDVLLLVK